MYPTFFLQDVLLCVQKLSCPLFGGIDATLLFMKKSKKDYRIDIRLNQEEYEKLRILVQDYPNLSSFVLDACWNFDSKLHLDKLSYIEDKFIKIDNLRKELNKVASNFNQLVQYTNNCIKIGVYLPNTADEIIRLTTEMNEHLQFYRDLLFDLEKNINKLVH